MCKDPKPSADFCALLLVLFPNLYILFVKCKDDPPRVGSLQIRWDAICLSLVFRASPYFVESISICTQENTIIERHVYLPPIAVPLFSSSEALKNAGLFHLKEKVDERLQVLSFSKFFCLEGKGSVELSKSTLPISPSTLLDRLNRCY